MLLNSWKQNNGVPQFERWCGTDSTDVQPDPSIDLRPPGAPLNASERLQTPYAWLTSDACRQQVGGGGGTTLLSTGDTALSEARA